MGNEIKLRVTPLSTKARLLIELRKNAGKPVSGSKLAADLGISRVSVWKGIQSLINASYPVETLNSGYVIPPELHNDFLYPWEFLQNEYKFNHYNNVSSTMDAARDLAMNKAAEDGTLVIAEKQEKGKGRGCNAWLSSQGGLYFTIIERPALNIADYCLPLMLYQIAVARVLASRLGKQFTLRWPNDVYAGKRKIAGILTELEGEGDSVKWLTIGIGVNVNNTVPLEGTVSCSDLAGRPVLRREILLEILNEAERLKKFSGTGIAYAQGNRFLAAEWNALAGCIGKKAAVLIPGTGNQVTKSRVVARGIYSGIDPAGRCVIKTQDEKEMLHFSPGPVSVVF